MRGQITKRGKDSYTVILDAGPDPATGKRRQQWISVKGNKREAEAKLAELVDQVNKGTYMAPGKTTVSDFLGRWLKDYVWPNLAPRTAEGYEHIIRQHLIPSLGQMVLTQLKPEHLQRYYAVKLEAGRRDGKGGLSSKTVRHHHITLHTALETAVKWGLLMHNPADAVSAPRVHSPELHVWNEDEVSRFLEAARETAYYEIFYLALFTGMRRSEILALRWQDVDLLFGQVHVRRSLHHLRDGSSVFRPPKTAKGRRAVALPPSATIMLQGWRAKQEKNRAMLGVSLSDSDLLFAQLDGSPMLPDTITHAWIKLVRRLGIEPIRFHDAR
ncbi:MAG: tyrosine-type recombinase/integrase, partial [Dehalococcoidia bacterium]|nr:tyrosine-type recombinase/integrase [Dehalococcoidia bacterium]